MKNNSLKPHFLLITVFCFAFFLLSLPTPTSAALCHSYDSNDPVREGWGAAYDVIYSPYNVIINVDCSTDNATITVGNGRVYQYVWNTGYIWQNGAWQTINLTPQSQTVSGWYTSRASASINLTPAELAGDNYVIFYTCMWDNVKWRCGCHDATCANAYWQEQHFSYGTSCTDADGDYFITEGSILGCASVCGSSHDQSCLGGNDCDDTRSFIYPGAVESCDTYNNDCDAGTDEGCDDDSDGYCDDNMAMYNNNSMCVNTPFLTNGQYGDDCNDAVYEINPGRTEICENSTDEDCDGSTTNGCITGDVYYVTQSGGGGNGGNGTLADPWSMDQFNALVGTDYAGDMFYFSGTFTTELVPKISGTTVNDSVILDGWEEGSCNPVADHDSLTFGGDDNVDLNACPNAALIDLNDIYTIGIRLNGNDYIIIQDFEIRDCRAGILLDGDPDATTYVTVRRNYIHDNYGNGFANTLGFENNIYNTIGGALGDGNFFYNNVEKNRAAAYPDGAAQHINIAGTDLVFSYNEVSQDFVPLNDLSSNALEVHTGNNQLIEYNSISYSHPDAIISVKANGGANKILRFNKLSHGEYGISISTEYPDNHDVYVYGNFMFDIKDQRNLNDLGQALRTFYSYDNIWFWNNVISNSDSHGIAIFTQTGGTPGDVYVYNNTVHRAGLNTNLTLSQRSGMYIYTVGTGLNLRTANNIFSECDIINNYSVYNNQVPDERISTWEHNLYYNSSDTAVIRWTSSYVGPLMTTLTNNSSWGDNGLVENPYFTDPNGADNINGTEDDNFSLQNGSPAINSGIDLSRCFYIIIQGIDRVLCLDDALDPANTDWTQTPPRVNTVKRDIYGWSRGAYAYTEQ